LIRLKAPAANWQVTAIGRAGIWPLHRRCAELGGHVRSGLDDTFYRDDGAKVSSNGPLIDQLATYVRDAGRQVASPAEARAILKLQ
ncbi:3-keto-5-aminohexanoate cleavage protein, partial [Acinetobacter baumannii]